MINNGRRVILRLLALASLIASPRAQSAWRAPAVFGYHGRARLSARSTAFTQGLEYVDGVLYEGTGLNGRSSIRKVALETGKVLQKRDVSAEHFGEGITVWKNDLIELTWKSHVAFVYDRATFQPKQRFLTSGEGWGLTHDRHASS